MKHKFILSLCAVVVLVVALLWLFRDGEKQKLSSVAEVPDANAPAKENGMQPSVGARLADANLSAPASVERARPDTVDSITPEEKEAKVRAEIEAKNVPFNFYGLAIDQDSNALAGVKFKLAVRHWNTTTLGAIHIGRETDAGGRFDIHGETGDAFDVEDVGKAGYELEPGQRSFGAVGGSSESPVIFKMWSTNIHEQLITGDKKFPISPDGRAYVIDLAKGTIAESGDGDLTVWIKYAAKAVRGQAYDWSCEIDAINGGLLEEPLGTAMYVAPAEGYTPAFQFQQQIRDGQSGSIGTRRFYVRLNNGQVYGRIIIELDAPYNDRVPGRVRVQYALNPSGSRILR